MGRARPVPIDGGMHHGSRTAVRLGPEAYPFEPDALLGVQMARRAATQPEKVLLCAVLESAVEDLITTRQTNDGLSVEKLRAGAVAWLASEDRSWPCAFLSICDALGLEPEPIRRALLAAPPVKPARRRVGGRHVVRVA